MSDDANQQTSLDEIVDEYTGEAEDETVDAGKLQEIDESPVEGWELHRLGEVFSLEYGENLTEDARDGGQYPVYGSNGQVGSHSEPYVDSPGIIVGRKGSIGEAEFSEESFCPIDTTYYISDDNTNENLRFIYYLIENTQLSRLNAASAIPGLNRNDAYSLKGLIPPLQEQRKIASVLYNVDQAIQKTECVIDQLKTVQKGLYQNFFRNWSDQTAYDPLVGEYPESWPLKELSEATTITDAEHFTPEYTDSGIPVIRPGDLSPGRISLDDVEKQVDEETYRELTQRYTPARDDIVYSRSQNFAVASRVLEDEKYCIGQDMVVIETGGVDKAFLLHLLNSPLVKNQAIRMSSGSTFSRVNLGDIRSYKTPIPDQHVQQEIGEILSTIEEQLISQEKYHEQLHRLKQGLSQDLLSGEVRTFDRDINILPEVENHG